ncbi:MAG: DUF1425 domain-containing protein [bacterium]
MKESGVIKKLGSFFLIFIFMGCSSCVRTGALSQNTTNARDKYEINPHIIVHNNTLARSVQIVALHSRVVNNVRQVWVQVKNTQDSDLACEYRFQWLDKKNSEIKEGAEQWRPALLYGQEVKTLVSVSPHPSAEIFKIHMREKQE